MSLGAPAAAVLAGAAGPAVVTVNPFKWGTYLEHMQVNGAFQFLYLLQVK
jgi:hypothetical protein